MNADLQVRASEQNRPSMEVSVASEATESDDGLKAENALFEPSPSHSRSLETQGHLRRRTATEGAPARPRFQAAETHPDPGRWALADVRDRALHDKRDRDEGPARAWARWPRFLLMRLIGVTRHSEWECTSIHTRTEMTESQTAKAPQFYRTCSLPASKHRLTLNYV